MCGFTGFLALQAAQWHEPVLKRMADAIFLRGPDDAGYWLGADSGVGLVHRRLAVVDLSAAGHQPMASGSGRYVLVFNGEIYNHLDLRAELDVMDSCISLAMEEKIGCVGCRDSFAGQKEGALATPEPSVQVYRTDVGERATVTLADGSQATLNTASELAVEYTRSRRGLRLISGEAWFDVAKNPERPFVVRAGAHTVTATGTSFDVRIATGALRVAVTEGRVRVAAADETWLASVGAGQLADVSAGAVRLSTAGPNGGDWRSGRLQFDTATLSEAVAEMNRYRRTPIVMDDPGLGSLRISGVFEAGEASGFVDALPLTHAVRVTRSAQAVHIGWRGAEKKSSGM